jgi:hypothetical protein
MVTNSEEIKIADLKLALERKISRGAKPLTERRSSLSLWGCLSGSRQCLGALMSALPFQTFIAKKGYIPLPMCPFSPSSSFTEVSVSTQGCLLSLESLPCALNSSFLTSLLQVLSFVEDSACLPLFVRLF